MLCSKGNVAHLRPPKEERDNTISSVLMSPRGEHSSKPKEVRSIITKIFGNKPRIEIFARERVPGWDAIGYDIDGLDIKESLRRQINL